MPMSMFVSLDELLLTTKCMSDNEIRSASGWILNYVVVLVTEFIVRLSLQTARSQRAQNSLFNRMLRQCMQTDLERK